MKGLARLIILGVSAITLAASVMLLAFGYARLNAVVESPLLPDPYSREFARRGLDYMRVGILLIAFGGLRGPDGRSYRLLSR